MIEVRKRLRLPHWYVPHGLYFVTFNVHDAFPAAHGAKLLNERAALIADIERLRGRATPAEIDRINRLLRAKSEQFLDEGHGAAYMRDPRIATLVADAIQFFR